MSETIIDYDKTNKYLPNSLRLYVGASNRMTRQDFRQFIAMYSGIEQLAVFNNRTAAEFASGFTDLNYMYLRSGVAPRLLDIVVSKAVGRVWYQADEENEVSFNDYLDSNYFSDALYKASEETAQTGRSIMVIYESKDEEQKLEILSYNLFRHRILYDKKKNVKEAFIYIVNLETGTAGYEQVVCEHRFYKEKKDEQGKKVKVPYQEFLIYAIDFRNKNKEEATTSIITNITQELAAKFPNIKFNQAREMNYPTIGVYDLRYTKVNKKFFDTDIPEAMFTDAVDNAVTIDTSITGKEVEKEIGRGQVLVPEFEQVGINEYITQDAAGGRLMRSLSVSFKDPVFKKYPTRSTEDSKPQNVQFDIRSSEWVNEIDNDTARLCENVGVGILDYCPRLLGGQQRTDDEINAMTDITANTVKNFRNLNQRKINQLLTDVATYHKLNIHISIRWDMAAILNPTKNTQLIKEQLSAGLISRKEAIRRANPNLTPNEVEQLYKEVMSEIGAMATENAFNNF